MKNEDSGYWGQWVCRNSPVEKYHDVNVHEARNVLEAKDKAGVKRIIFTSSVAVYGLNKKNPNEQHPADPFNHYGKSKWQAEGAPRVESKRRNNIRFRVDNPIKDKFRCQTSRPYYL